MIRTSALADAVQLVAQNVGEREALAPPLGRVNLADWAPLALRLAAPDSCDDDAGLSPRHHGSPVDSPYGEPPSQFSPPSGSG
jgi:hypothetical protein